MLHYHCLEFWKHTIVGRDAPHLIRQSSDGLFTHQTDIDGQVYDQVKDPNTAAKSYFKDSGAGVNRPKKRQRFCCKIVAPYAW
jgi:hypothetical protein